MSIRNVKNGPGTLTKNNAVLGRNGPVTANEDTLIITTAANATTYTGGRARPEDRSAHS